MDQTDQIAAEPKKGFLERHKVAVAVTITAFVVLTVNGMVLKKHEQFLRERSLLDDYQEYTPARR